MTAKQPRPSNRCLAANGHECYEIYAAEPSFVRQAIELLVQHHKFKLVGEPAAGFDEIAATVRRGDIQLSIGWDNWTGFGLLAVSDAGDSVVRELADFFDAIKVEPRFDRYFSANKVA